MTKLTWPCWFTSPDGTETGIFKHESDVPRGWTSGAEKITISALQEPAPKAVAPVEAPAEPAKRGRKPKPEPLDL